MKYLSAVLCLAVFAASEVRAKIVVEEVDYKAGDTQMMGYLAYDDEKADKLPGVAIVHEWWGNNDYPKSRAQELAKLGYIAFAIDMYGKGKLTDDPKQAGEWAGMVKKDANLERERFTAGLKVLQDQPRVNREKLAAIGYCFGGTMVLDAARRNDPLKGVVSFHGDLSTEHPATGKITPRILVCTGDADAFVPASQLEQFGKEMAKADAAATIVHYPGAQHAFTNPDADKHHLENIKYDADADKRSWEQMRLFFAEIFK